MMRREKRAAWIKSRLALKRMTLVELAGSMGVTVRMVLYVINGERKSTRMREMLASILGTTVERLWGKDGKEKKQRQEAGAAEKRRAVGG
jgi:transcriptional regulator with XRE-family HTH domain